MYEKDYKELVLADYEMKKAAGLLLSELLVHTPGSLKAACEKVCERRFDNKDEIILESFFNKKENAAAYQRTIELAKADLFRPLNKYIGDPSVNTTMRNINLLAWLIDFQPRPFHPNLTAPIKPQQSVRPGGDGIKVVGKLYKKEIIASILLLIFIGVGYWVYKMPTRVNGDEDCMIWAYDHYQPVYCKDQHGANLKWPIDHKLVDGFRRFTKPDTLSRYWIKIAFYTVFNGRHEFFTTDGPCPLDTNKRLLPMSEHIYEKYILHIKN